MRKTSQDGGDSTSATSGFENETKKPKSGLLEFKSKKLAKRTAPNLSEESDDAVVEPLLQKNTNTSLQSAKYFAKAKADTVKEISKLFNDKKSQYASTSGFGTTETLLSEKDQVASKPNPSTNAPLHNYMNTNIFHSKDSSKVIATTKSQVLVEIDESKQSGFSPSPLIFTTAKIHTNDKSKHMEPVQMTPAPIISTVEVSVSKSGNITTNEKKVSNGTSAMNTIYPQPNENEKTKYNTINVSIATVSIQELQNKDNMTNKTANSSKTIIPIAPSEIITYENPKENTINVNYTKNTPVTQSKYSKTAYSSQSITTLSNNPLGVLSSPEPAKAADVSEPSDKMSEQKMLIDEPRIIMSESKLKVSDSTKTNVSEKATKSSLESNETLKITSIKQPQTSQPINQKLISETKTSSLVDDTKNKNIEKKDPIHAKNVKSPVIPKELSAKSNQQKMTTTEAGFSKSNTEIKTEIPSSKLSEDLKDPCAKTSPTKTTTQSKMIESKINKEIDKSPKLSAKDISKINTKISLNETATSSTNKLPTSTAISKHAPSVSSPNVVSSIISDTSKKTLNNSSVSNSKAIPPIVATTTLSSSAIKTQSSTKTGTSTVNTKPTPVTSTKDSTKTASTSSIKSPLPTSTSISSATKQSNISTTKTASSKPLSLASTKTPHVTSSPMTVASAKQTTSKIAQISTSKSSGNRSSSVTSSSAAGMASNSSKTKAIESNKKLEAKSSDNTKGSKA